jgi:hypothetical protein
MGLLLPPEMSFKRPSKLVRSLFFLHCDSCFIPVPLDWPLFVSHFAVRLLLPVDLRHQSPNQFKDVCWPFLIKIANQSKFGRFSLHLRLLTRSFGLLVFWQGSKPRSMHLHNLHFFSSPHPTSTPTLYPPSPHLSSSLFRCLLMTCPTCRI